MAQKKKGDAGGLILVLFVVFVLIALATPVVLILGFLYFNSLVAEETKRLKNSPSDFWLTDEEKSEFKKKVSQLSEVTTALREANQKGASEGVSKNQDGSFSARSKLGKELRQIIERADPMKATLAQQLDALQLLPQSRWAAFNKNVARGRACLIALLCWIVALIYYAVKFNKVSISSIFISYWGLATNWFRETGTKIPMADGDMQMIAIATCVAIVSYFLGTLIFKNKGAKYSPIPPKVTLENINTY